MTTATRQRLSDTSFSNVVPGAYTVTETDVAELGADQT